MKKNVLRAACFVLAVFGGMGAWAYSVGDTVTWSNTGTTGTLATDTYNQCQYSLCLPALDGLGKGSVVKITNVKFGSWNTSFTGWDSTNHRSDPYAIKINGVQSGWANGASSASDAALSSESTINVTSTDTAYTLSYAFSDECDITVGTTYSAASGNTVCESGQGVSFLYSNSKLSYGSSTMFCAVRHVSMSSSGAIVNASASSAGYYPVYEITATIVSIATETEIGTDEIKTAAEISTDKVTLKGGTLDLSAVTSFPVSFKLSENSTGGMIKLASDVTPAVKIMAAEVLPDSLTIYVGDSEPTTKTVVLSGDYLYLNLPASTTFTAANDTDWADKTLTFTTLTAAAGENVSFANDSNYKQTVTEGDVTVALVTDAAAGTRVFALHALDGSSAGIGAISRDIYLKVSGGTPGVISGGEDAGWNATKTVVTGDTLVNVGGSTVVDYVYGAGLGGGSGVTTTGDIGVVIDGDAQVKGSAVVGWQGRHNSTAKVTGNTTMLVKNVQTYDSSTATADVGNGSCDKGLIVGGGVCWGNGGVSTIGGNSSVVVDLGDTATGTFAKTLIGGSYHISSWGTMTVSGNSSVSISAPSAVTFSKEITGGGYTLGSSSVVSGNSSVTINGGTYTGTIYAGGNHSAATVGGTATLNLNGGTFTGATLKGGTATGAKTLNVNCDMSRDASSWNISGFTAMNIASEKTMTITADSDASIALDTTGSGAIAKTGTGTLTLSDLVEDATYSLTVSAGSLNLSGDASGVTVTMNSTDGTLNVGSTRPTVNYQAGKLKLTASSTELAAGKITLTTTEDSAAASTDITTVVDAAGNTYTITDASKTDNVITLTLQTITPITKDSTSKNTSDAIGSFTSGTLIIQGADSADDAYDVVFDAEVPSGVSVSVSGYVNLTVDGTAVTALPYSQISFESGAVVKMATGDSYTVPAGITVTSTSTSGTITNNGTLNLSAGTYTITNNGTANVAGDTTITLTNNGTFNVNSGNVTVTAASAQSILGTVNIASGATYTNNSSDAIAYSGSTIVNVRGTLDMGAYRWTIGGSSVLNLYGGCTINGTISDGMIFDLYRTGNTINVYAGDDSSATTVTLPLALRARTDSATVTVDTGMTFEVPGFVCSPSSWSESSVVTKAGAGKLAITGDMSASKMTISAGTVEIATGTGDDAKDINVSTVFSVAVSVSGTGTVKMNGSTISLGTLTAAATNKYTVDGESTLTLACEYSNGGGTIMADDTKDSPFIKINSDATLNLNYANFSGWSGALTGGYIVNNGTLKIGAMSSSSMFFRNHLILADGATTTIGTTIPLSIYGGIGTADTAQFQLASGTASITGGTICFGNGSNTGGYGTKGVGFTVGDDATLTIGSNIMSSKNSSGSNPIAKYGNGTLVFTDSSNSTAETYTIYAGTIKSVASLTVASGKTTYTVVTTTETVDDVTYNIYSLNHDACDVYYVDGYLGDSSDKYTVTSDGTTSTVLVAGDTLVIDSKSSRTQVWVATTLPSEIEKIRIDRDVEMTAGASGSILGGADITISTGATLTIGVNAWNTTAVASTAKFTLADGGKLVVNCDTFEGSVTTTVENKHVNYDSSTKTYSVIYDTATITIPEVAGMTATAADGDGNAITITEGKVTVDVTSTLVVTYTPSEGYVGTTQTVTIETVASDSTVDTSSVTAPTEGVAKVTADGTTTYYTSVNDAITAAGDAGTVVLVKDWSGYFNDSMNFTGTLDLNGKTITLNNGWTDKTWTIATLVGTADSVINFTKPSGNPTQNLTINNVDNYKGKITITSGSYSVTLPNGYKCDTDGYVVAITYATLTITQVDNCTITVKNGETAVESGAKFDEDDATELTVTRTPANGYELDGCSATETITMSEDVEVTAAVKAAAATSTITLSSVTARDDYTAAQFAVNVTGDIEAGTKIVVTVKDADGNTIDTYETTIETAVSESGYFTSEKLEGMTAKGAYTYTVALVDSEGATIASSTGVYVAGSGTASSWFSTTGTDDTAPVNGKWNDDKDEFTLTDAAAALGAGAYVTATQTATFTTASTATELASQVADIPTDAQGVITVGSTDDGYAFYALVKTDSGRAFVQMAGCTPALDTEYTIKTEFDYANAGKVRFSVKSADDSDYTVLTYSGSEWLANAKDSAKTLASVLYVGAGTIGALSGSYEEAMVCQDASGNQYASVEAAIAAGKGLSSSDAITLLVDTSWTTPGAAGTYYVTAGSFTLTVTAPDGYSVYGGLGVYSVFENTVYIWTGAAGDSEWTTPGNWKVGETACTDAYPGSGYNEQANFLANTEATITISSDMIYLADMSFGAGSKLKFIGVGTRDDAMLWSLGGGDSKQQVPEDVTLELDGFVYAFGNVDATRGLNYACEIAGKITVDADGTLATSPVFASTGALHNYGAVRLYDSCEIVSGATLDLHDDSLFAVKESTMSQDWAIYLNTGSTFTLPEAGTIKWITESKDGGDYETGDSVSLIKNNLESSDTESLASLNNLVSLSKVVNYTGAPVSACSSTLSVTLASDTDSNILINFATATTPTYYAPLDATSASAATNSTIEVDTTWANTYLNVTEGEIATDAQLATLSTKNAYGISPVEAYALGFEASAAAAANLQIALTSRPEQDAADSITLTLPNLTKRSATGVKVRYVLATSPDNATWTEGGELESSTQVITLTDLTDKSRVKFIKLRANLDVSRTVWSFGK